MQRKLGIVFKTTDFSVVLHDGRLAGQEVPTCTSMLFQEMLMTGKSMMAM